MPYRIDIASPPPSALDLLIELGALDVDAIGGGLAAILPDAATPEIIARTFGPAVTRISPAVARDNESVWLLSPRAIRIGNSQAEILLTDSNAFGTGHHPTTAMCIEALEEILALDPISAILDIGIGSGILAFAALQLGVPQAVGLDIDDDALQAAAENARRNALTDRLQLIRGGPDAVTGCWPLVVANVLAAPLIEMAPHIVRRVASRGRLILSGIPRSLESEVQKSYEHLGMWHTGSKERAGWVMLSARASW